MEDTATRGQTRTTWRDAMRVTVPEGRQGPWTVRRFEVAEHSIENLRLMLNGGRQCRPGTYTQLVHDRQGIVMSDTDAEAHDHYEPYHQARGRVLIHGLGLGMVLGAALSKPGVEHVDVVELDPDVIALVGPHYTAAHGDRVSIHQGDAYTYTWPKAARWDVVWHDIWWNLCEDNLEEMTRLHRRFGRRCGWQGSWGRELLRSLRARERRNPWGWG